MQKRFGTHAIFAIFLLLRLGRIPAFSLLLTVPHSTTIPHRFKQTVHCTLPRYTLSKRTQGICLRGSSSSSNDTNSIDSKSEKKKEAEETIMVNDGEEGEEFHFPYPSEGLQQQPLESMVATEESIENTSIDYDAAYVLFSSAIVGIMSGFAVALFKLSIELLREELYGTSLSEQVPLFLITALGGLGVAALAATGSFSPGLRGTANEIDSLSLNTQEDERFADASRFVRKPLAAIATLGSGCSLGPEGPSVEVGMSISRICMPPTPRSRGETDAEIATRIRRNRLLLSAGAAAGVAAGFNAPLAGVFFALEIVQQFQPPLATFPTEPIATPSLEEDNIASIEDNDEGDYKKKYFQPMQQDFLSGPGSITAILLASVLSALVAQVYLGDSLTLVLPSYQLKTPLVELPLYLLLGVVSGVAAGSFTALAQFFKGVFDGEAGPVYVQETMRILPKWTKPVIGGVTCGVVGMFYPQILFFGYETLNTLLAKSYVPTDLVLTLLAVKTFTTAVSAGSGLVGGTFAPSLFLGGMVGASFHNIIAEMFLLAKDSTFQLADVQAYAIVGAAGVLAALFKAPLTASLLLFELTRDYEVILPVVASAGVGSVIGDLVEKTLEEKRRDRDAVSWGDLSDDDEVLKLQQQKKTKSKSMS